MPNPFYEVEQPREGQPPPPHPSPAPAATAAAAAEPTPLSDAPPMPARGSVTGNFEVIRTDPLSERLVIIIIGVIALGTLGGAIVLAWSEKQVPDLFSISLGTALGALAMKARGGQN